MKSQSIATIIVLGCIAAFLSYACRPDWQFARLERNARKVITPTQLQTWAVWLLAKSPTNTTPRVSELGTSFPSQLLGLYHLPPYVRIQKASTNSLGSVLLAWGGGLIGHSDSRSARPILSAIVSTHELGSPVSILGATDHDNVAQQTAFSNARDNAGALS